MRHVSSLLEKEDLAGSFAAVESFAIPEGMPELQSDVLGFRADLKERLGRGTALREFFQLKPDKKVTPEDHLLCSDVSELSWQILGLTGHPDQSDMRKVVAAIKEGEARPRRR